MPPSTTKTVTKTSISADGVTVIGGSGAGDTAFSTGSGVNPSGGDQASLEIDNSIAANVETSLSRTTDGVNPNGGVANMVVTYSDYDPAAILDFNSRGGSGSILAGAGNVNVNPGFVAPGRDYRLAAGSPLIDIGRPGALPAGASTTDLAGAPRLVDGNGDGTARRDIGAYELQPPTVTPPTVTPPTVTPPVGGVQGADTTKPLLGLGLSPKSFRAAGSGPSIAAALGTTVTYTLSEAATVAFRIERARPGRRVGGKCVKPRRSNRRSRRCTRYVTLRGSFTDQGKVGSNKAKFSGRLRGRKLKPGRYRLRAVAADPAKNRSLLKRSSFRILR